jgi:hypothetical protein
MLWWIIAWLAVGWISIGFLNLWDWLIGCDVTLQDLVRGFVCGIFGPIVLLFFLAEFYDDNRYKTIIRGRGK